MLDKIKECATGPCAQKILYFEEMLTPSVIRIAYWLGLFAVVLGGLRLMFSGGFDGFLKGIICTAIGVILVRVVAELVILFFKIQEDIEQVAENTKTKPPVKRKTAKKVTKKTS